VNWGLLRAARKENVTIERATDLSYRAVGAVFSARCWAG
jgi:hypothetical protein